MRIQKKLLPWSLTDNNGNKFVSLWSGEKKKFDQVTYGDAIQHCTESFVNSTIPGRVCRKGRSCPLYMARNPSPICRELIYNLKDTARRDNVISSTDQINLRSYFDKIREDQCLANPNLSWCGCYERDRDKTNYTNIVDALSSGGFSIGNPQCWYKPCKQMDPDQLHMIPSSMTDFFSRGLHLGPDTSESFKTYEQTSDGSIIERESASCPQAMCQNINIVSDSLILGDLDLNQKIDCKFTQTVVNPVSGSTETEFKNPETTHTETIKDPNENISVVRNDDDDEIEITRPENSNNNNNNSNNNNNNINKEQLEEQRRLMMAVLGSLFFVFVLLVFVILSQN